MSPLMPEHSCPSTFGIGVAPSWMATTITSAPWARNWGTRALAVAASSSKQAFHARRAHHGGRGLERHADEAHRHGGIALRRNV